MERVAGGASQQPVSARSYGIIGADHFATLGIRMVRGREFTRAEEESPSAPSVAIVDEILARRMFGDEDPVGQMIRIVPRADEPESASGEPMQVVGIAPPIREQLLDRQPATHVYVPFGRNYRATMHVHVKAAPGGDEQATLETLRKEIRSADPRLPVLALSTMQGFHCRSIELWALKTAARLFTMLGVLALLLAGVGVYGVKSYVVSQRTREIGIRMAPGASAPDVLRLILRDGLLLTATGVAIGLPLAALVSFVFTRVFADVGGFDVLVVASATVILASAATLATAIPARRASKVQPLQALRAE